jgi:ribonucleoside-diphosphate reductase alpha chain
VSFDKILKRIKTLGHFENEQPLQINYTDLAIKVIDQIYDGIDTSQLDELTAEQCASLTTLHPDFGKLATRVIISNLHKNTCDSFSKVMYDLYHFKDIHGKHVPMISDELYEASQKNSDLIDNTIVHERDYLFDYFGIKTLERAYLMRINGVIVERPQYTFMRVALGIHTSNMFKAIESYNLMSQKYFTHATPTLFNAGTPRPQMSSCYLLAMEDDSIKGIYSTLADCASISKYAGGIGLHIHNVRASGTHIRGTNGTSNGIVPMLRVYNNTARYVDQCVTPETIIYTTQGPKKICDVIVGETEIFNKQGQTEVIENVLEHSYDGEIYNIETMHTLFNLKITSEHPVLGIQNQKRNTNYNVIKNRLEKGLAKVDWIDVKDITTDTMIGYAIPKYTKDIASIREDDCYFYGLLLGDGHMVENKAYGHITMNNTTKTKQIEFIKNYLQSKFIRFVEEESDTRDVVRIRWNKSVEMPFKYSDVYNSNKEKHIQYRFLNLPTEKTQHIVRGLIDSDGTKHNELVFDTTSKELMEGLRFLLLKMEILTSGYIRDRIGESHVSKYGSTITNQKISYCLRIPKTPEICQLCDIDNGNQFYKYFKHNNYLFSRVKNITKEKYSGSLYDLQMSDEHNYMLHNGVVHNGGGKRNGSFAMYLEPWHADIEDFLEMKKNHGDEEIKARDLFYALWIPDLFMERVKNDGDWTLMCPDKCPGLSNVYGDKFNELYTTYESEGKGNKTLKARKLWIQILDSQIETGTPYLLYKDAANRKSNQQNLGTIKSSNLCCEIIEYSDDKETAVCNLASIGLPKFVEPYQQKHDENIVVYGRKGCVYWMIIK